MEPNDGLDHRVTRFEKLILVTDSPNVKSLVQDLTRYRPLAQTFQFRLSWLGVLTRQSPVEKVFHRCGKLLAALRLSLGQVVVNVKVIH